MTEAKQISPEKNQSWIRRVFNKVYKLVVAPLIRGGMFALGGVLIRYLYIQGWKNPDHQMITNYVNKP